MAAPHYVWTCKVCDASNAAGTDRCSSCAFPAMASPVDVAAARGEPNPLERTARRGPLVELLVLIFALFPSS